MSNSELVASQAETSTSLSRPTLIVSTFGFIYFPVFFLVFFLIFVSHTINRPFPAPKINKKKMMADFFPFPTSPPHHIVRGEREEREISHLATTKLIPIKFRVRPLLPAKKPEPISLEGLGKNFE